MALPGTRKRASKGDCSFARSYDGQMSVTIRPVMSYDWPAVAAIFNHTECGRFRRVGRKRGQDFDMVWMQLTP